MNSYVGPEIYGATAILILAHLLPFFYERGSSLFLQPQKLSAIVSGVTTIPHAVIICFKPDFSELYGYMGSQVMEYMTYFCLSYSLGLVAMYVGISAAKLRTKHITVNLQSINTKGFGSLIVFLIVCYVTSLALILQSAGGIFEFVGNFANRAELLAGTGIYYIIKTPAAYLSIMLLVTNYCLNRKPNIVVVISIILMMVGAESILGGRRTPIQFLVFAFITYAIMKGRIRLISPTSVLVTVMSGFLFWGLLFVRYQLNPSADVSELSIFKVLVNASYNDIYIFILDHFSTAPFWHGSIFLDFAYRIIPMPGGVPPPSLDEGVYVYNLYLGRSVYPPTSMIHMYHNSWPANTYGNGYMNFGLIGVVGFFFIKGVITGLAHRFAILYNLNVFFVFIYLFIVFAFQVSNQRITELLALLAGCAAIYYASFLIKAIDAARGNR